MFTSYNSVNINNRVIRVSDKEAVAKTTWSRVTVGNKRKA